MEPPRPLCVKRLSYIKPRDATVLVELPALNNLSYLLLAQVGNLAQNAFIVLQLSEKASQLLFRGDACLVLVELNSEHFLDLVLLPFVEAVLGVASPELVFVLLLLSRHGDPCVRFGLVEVGSRLFLLESLLLFNLPELTHLSVQVLLPFTELLRGTGSIFLAGCLKIVDVFIHFLGLQSLFNCDHMSV